MNLLKQFKKFKLRYCVMILLLIMLISSTCNPPYGYNVEVAESDPAVAAGVKPEPEIGEPPLAAGATDSLFDNLWADSAGTVSAGTAFDSSSNTVSVDVRDANLLDVLSILAIKMDVEIIFLPEDPGTVTFKAVNLSPVTVFQLLLQREDLDYLVIGRNYLIGERAQLHMDYFNRMYLSRYGLDYISGDNLIALVSELGIPVEIVTVAENNRAIWAQGTPIALGKLMEAITAFDRRENVAFARGGERIIRMPVATATGSNAKLELDALIELLSVLLDGYQDGRTDDWHYWDHPGTYTRMDWNDPTIQLFEIKMKITRDFAENPDNQLRYLLAEGTPDHIEIVKKMIEEIRGTGYSPISFALDDEEDEEDEED